ncbi:biotin--[acetyl-CoA-carboxylase] ligase [Marinilactibacillus sp. 15R]|uniref:biotin--[acetyl-CoA-carboxylase] ligase n=1 Tax=Marinilactibacillus sp. 15R TaxID=1911586 RepID=UPI00090A8FB5|nr:biotin--[acetyl-CoA-carboxylase] ligase [Marinilactibacillus sp. 15R]API89242.1 biotin--[acetyl-CoA-carboxylase] ligase [Marinilactibacillus sp. 15R]
MNVIEMKTLLLDHLNKVYPQSETIQILMSLISSDQDILIQLVTELLLEDKMPLVRMQQEIRLLYPILSIPAVQSGLKTHSLGKPTLLFQTISSTNDYLKNNLNSLDNGTLILAHKQSFARGRLGRTWSSPAGNTISMSLLLKPEKNNFNYSLLTQLAAAALIKALTFHNTIAEIKWPNDIVVNRKKVAGILTETEYSGNTLEGIILGIGINTNLDESDIPLDIREKATSLKSVIGPVDPNSLVSRFLNEFERLFDGWITTWDTKPFLEICRNHSALIGGEYWIEENRGIKSSKRKAKIETINDTGFLVVTYLDTFEKATLTSTNYSIRADNTYI